MSKGAASRAAAAYSLQQVLHYQRSLNQALPEAIEKFKLTGEDKGFAQAMAFGVLRELPTLEWYLSQLLDKPLKAKVRVVHYLMLVGLYQLTAMRTAQHAAVSATVDATGLLRQKALKGLVNAILRAFLRQQEPLQQQVQRNGDKHWNHPGWLLKRLRAAYPEQWQRIVEANQVQPPMWLRVNPRYLQRHQLTLDDYQLRLAEDGVVSTRVNAAGGALAHALRLERATDVVALSGFGEGAVSVQDAAAQFAPSLLPLQAGDYVLDACAAPGGKTAHLLELADVQLDALDIEPQRLTRVAENLQRLQLKATIIEGDASTRDWWSGQAYDHILLDAPCSATGVVRRHPDIKWLRQDSDIAELVALQRRILENLWGLLKPGGILVYATCSVLPDENSQQVAQFVAAHQDALVRDDCIQAIRDGSVRPDTSADVMQMTWQQLRQLSPSVDNDASTTIGMQWLPSINGHDGFYYAVLQKRLD